jgi:hypothetical protein
VNYLAFFAKKTKHLEKFHIIRRKTMDEKKEKNTENKKEGFQSFWQKTSDLGKKAAEGAKTLAEQTKKNIYESQAKKYTPVTIKDYKSKSFKIPDIIEIVDNSANKKFITQDGAVGWIEKHEEVDVFHMYSEFVKKCGLEFIPLAQCDNVYCSDIFEREKYINSNCIFGKATEERLAELEHIANCLGATSCSIEIVESDSETISKSFSAISKISAESSQRLESKNFQSGKTVSHFQGNRTPRRPELKWFLHDDNIKRLIEMRCGEESHIKSKILELKGASSATMSRKIACAIDEIMNVKGSFSMENQVVKEHSNILMFEVEF